MADSTLHFAGALVMGTVIAFSFYMVRNTKGRMSEGFKIMLIGHMPLMLLHAVEAMATAYGTYGEKLVFLEHTAQVIAVISIFMAVYVIRGAAFGKAGGVQNEG